MNFFTIPARFHGFIFATLTMVGLGFLPVYSYLFIQKVDPLFFGGFTCLIGALPLMLGLAKKGHNKFLFTKTPQTSQLALITIFTIFSSIFFLIGAKLTSGINTALLTQIEPLYGTLLAIFILGERLQKSEVVAIGFLFLGSIILVFKGLTPPSIGDIFILLAPFFAQLSHMFSKKLIAQLPNPTIIPATRLFYGGIVLIVLGLIFNPSALFMFFHLDVIIGIITFALIFRTLTLFSWYKTLERLPAAKAAAFIPLAMVVAFIGTIIVLHETPTLRHYLGLAAIMGGTMWITHSHLRTSKQ